VLSFSADALMTFARFACDSGKYDESIHGNDATALLLYDKRVDFGFGDRSRCDVREERHRAILGLLVLYV
jgi:hypothetical protein